MTFRQMTPLEFANFMRDIRAAEATHKGILHGFWKCIERDVHVLFHPTHTVYNWSSWFGINLIFARCTCGKEWK